jgi:glyoxalase superfamily protein
MPGFASLAMLNLDAEDPAALATFYSQVLGWEVLHSEAEYAMIGDGSTSIGFGKLPGYSGPGWPDKAEEQALALGATKPTGQQPTPDRWRVLLDPGGHPFDLCLKSS